MSRRSLLRGAGMAAAGLAAAALAGCGSRTSATAAPTASGTAAALASASATATATPPAGRGNGGDFRAAFTGPFDGVDPHNSVYGGAGIVPQVYNYLLRQEVLRPEVGALYDLATGSQLQADQVTTVFKLRPGVKIGPNGYNVPERDLDTEDVLKSFDRIADPKSGANGYHFFHTWVAKYDAPDKQTIRLVTKQPYAWTLETIGDNLIGAIVPREWLTSPDLKHQAIGAGPFVLTELTEGQQATMTPNTNYYRGGLPRLGEYDILSYQDLATERTAFTARQIDTYVASDIDAAKQIATSTKHTVRYADRSTNYKSFWMRVDAAPWKDARVRRAVNRAMNRAQYVDIIGKGQGDPIGPLSSVFTQYALDPSTLATDQPYDVKQAKQLFDAAGVKEFTFAYPTTSNTVDFVNVFVQQLQQIGVTAKAQAMDAGSWVAAYYANKLTASLSLNQQYKTPDAALQWFHTGGVTGNGHYDTGFSVPAVDQAIDAAAQELNQQTRIQKYKTAQETILKHDPPFLNFYAQYSNVLVYDDVEAFSHGPGSIDSAFVKDYWVRNA